jgi:hypothetical protein
MPMVVMMMESSFLTPFAARLMPPQIIQPGKPPLTPQMVELADHVLMLRPVTGHVPLEVAPFGVQPLLADVTEHFIAVVAAGDVLVADLLVHEGLGAGGVGAFEGAIGVEEWGVEVFFRDVPG